MERISGVLLLVVLGLSSRSGSMIDWLARRLICGLRGGAA
jgi:hypothetical protein